MMKDTTGSRKEWLAARIELLEAEKAHTRRSDELARQRRALPWVPIDKEYRFDSEAGKASLADLFRGCSQLLVYHFMFGPDYTAGCPSCSAIADGFNGIVVHLENHDVAFTAVSRAPLAQLAATCGTNASTDSRDTPGMSAFALEDGVVYLQLPAST